MENLDTEVKMLRDVRKSQNSSDSIILSVLGSSKWDELVYKAQSERLSTTSSSPDFIDLRVDSSTALLRIAEENTISQLRRAFLIAVNRHQQSPSTLDIPIVTASDWVLQDTLHNPHCGETKIVLAGERMTISSCLEFDEASFEKDCLVEGFTSTDMQNLACRAAYRAGFYKMERNVQKLVWVSLMSTISKLLHPAFLSALHLGLEEEARFFLSDSISIEPLPKRVINVNDGESIRDIPPFPYLSERCCPYCRKVEVVATIVPKQIEDAALLRRLPQAKLYGHEWLHEDEDRASKASEADRKVEEAIAKAESKYEIHGEIDDESDDEDFDGSVRFHNGSFHETDIDFPDSNEEPAAKKRKMEMISNENELPEGPYGIVCPRDGVPKKWIDAAHAWDKKLHESCKHVDGFVPFELLPQLVPREQGAVAPQIDASRATKRPKP